VGWVRIKFVLRGSGTDAQGRLKITKCETMRERNKSSFHSSKVAIQTQIEPPPKFTVILCSSHHHPGRQELLI